MNIYAINTLWTRKDGRMSQNMTLLWAPSEDLAIQAHMDACKEDPEKISLIVRDVVEADKNFIEAVHEHLAKELAKK